MESWQIALVSITGFSLITSTIVGISLFLYYTKKEVLSLLEKKEEKYFSAFQTKGGCDLSHKAQDVRNYSFTNTLIEIKEDIKETKQDIKEYLRLCKGGK